MISFFEFEKILRKVVKNKEANLDDVIVLPKKPKFYKKKEFEKTEPNNAGNKPPRGGINKSKNSEPPANKCECECFPCSKLKRCSECSCKNCSCKGCDCKNYNKLKSKK
jgi:hypothetical protein